MKKYLIIVLLFGVGYAGSNLVYIHTKDGSVFESPNITQVTDSTIFLSSHNISLPLTLISKVNLEELNNPYSFISETCIGVMLGIGATRITNKIAPKHKDPAGYLPSRNYLGNFIMDHNLHILPITYILYFIIKKYSKVEVIDMGEWSNDGKMKFFNQYQSINSL